MRVVILALLLINTILASQKLAFVVTNYNYESDNGSKPYKNLPLEDQNTEIKKVFIRLGYKVISHENLNFSEFQKAITQFSQQSKNCLQSVFFYSGHGVVGSDGKQYLIPTDMAKNESTHAKKLPQDILNKSAVSIDQVYRAFPERKDYDLCHVLAINACRSIYVKENNAQQFEYNKEDICTIYSCQPRHISDAGTENELCSPFTKKFLHGIDYSNSLLDLIETLNRKHEQVDVLLPTNKNCEQVNLRLLSKNKGTQFNFPYGFKLFVNQMFISDFPVIYKVQRGDLVTLKNDNHCVHYIYTDEDEIGFSIEAYNDIIAYKILNRIFGIKLKKNQSVPLELKNSIKYIYANNNINLQDFPRLECLKTSQILEEFPKNLRLVDLENSKPIAIHNFEKSNLNYLILSDVNVININYLPKSLLLLNLNNAKFVANKQFFRSLEQLENLRSLIVSQLQWTQSEYFELEKLVNLDSLGLSGHSLEDHNLEEILRKLKKLRMLDVSENKTINTKDLSTIPHRKLKYINFANCQLNAGSIIRKFPSIEWLHFSGNNVQSFPQTLSNIQYLDITGSNVPDLDFKQAKHVLIDSVNSISSLPQSLRSIVIRNVVLSQDHAKKIGNLTALDNLILTNCNINDDIIDLIFPSGYFRGKRLIDLSNNNITQYKKIVAENNNLQTLVMRGNSIKSLGTLYRESIVNLDLYDNPIADFNWEQIKPLEKLQNFHISPTQTLDLNSENVKHPTSNNLRNLSLGGENKSKKWSSLAKYPILENVNLQFSNFEAKNLEDIVTLKNLNTVDLSNTYKITNNLYYPFTINKDKEHLPSKVKIDSDVSYRVYVNNRIAQPSNIHITVGDIVTIEVKVNYEYVPFSFVYKKKRNYLICKFSATHQKTMMYINNQIKSIYYKNSTAKTLKPLEIDSVIIGHQIAREEWNSFYSNFRDVKIITVIKPQNILWNNIAKFNKLVALNCPLEVDIHTLKQIFDLPISHLQINLNQFPMKNLDFIVNKNATLQNLHINVSHSKMTTLDFIKKWQNLQTLAIHLQGSNIKDTHIFKELPNLKFLYYSTLNNEKKSDFSPGKKFIKNSVEWFRKYSKDISSAKFLLHKPSKSTEPALYVFAHKKLSESLQRKVHQEIHDFNNDSWIDQWEFLLQAHQFFEDYNKQNATNIQLKYIKNLPDKNELYAIPAKSYFVAQSFFEKSLYHYERYEYYNALLYVNKAIGLSSISKFHVLKALLNSKLNNRVNKKKIVRICRENINSKDTQLRSLLGKIYFYAVAVKKDLGIAHKHFDFAKKQCDEAQYYYWLTKPITEETDKKMVDFLQKKQYQKLAKKSHAKAIEYLGNLYLYGKMVNKSQKRALDYFEQVKNISLSAMYKWLLTKDYLYIEVLKQDWMYDRHVKINNIGSTKIQEFRLSDGKDLSSEKLSIEPRSYQEKYTNEKSISLKFKDHSYKIVLEDYLESKKTFRPYQGQNRKIFIRSKEAMKIYSSILNIFFFDIQYLPKETRKNTQKQLMNFEISKLIEKKKLLHIGINIKNSDQKIMYRTNYSVVYRRNYNTQLKSKIADAFQEFRKKAFSGYHMEDHSVEIFLVLDSGYEVYSIKNSEVTYEKLRYSPNDLQNIDQKTPSSMCGKTENIKLVGFHECSLPTHENYVDVVAKLRLKKQTLQTSMDKLSKDGKVLQEKNSELRDSLNQKLEAIKILQHNEIEFKKEKNLLASELIKSQEKHLLLKNKAAFEKKFEEQEELIRETKIKIQEQKIINFALQMQYDGMWREFKREFDGNNIVKIYQRAQILQRNFNVFEILVKKDRQFQITHAGLVHIAKCTSQEDLSRFLEQHIPRSVYIDPSRSIFSVLIEPDAFLAQRHWLEAELKKMKVIYGVNSLPKGSKNKKISKINSQKRYSAIFHELKNEHDLVKIYQYAHILQKNFNVFEIVVKKDDEFQITHTGTTTIGKCTSQEELSRFLEKHIPRSVHIEPSWSIFTVFIEPNSILNRRTWLEIELKKMKVIFDVDMLIKEETLKKELEQLKKQKKSNKVLQKQYDKILHEFKNVRNILRIYQRARILRKNFNVFEVTIKENRIFRITHAGIAHDKRCNSQEDLQYFLEKEIPRSVHIDPSRSIFSVLMEPHSLYLQRYWLENELKKMRVIYDIHLLEKLE